MSEDTIEEIDARLTETLPEDPHQQPEKVSNEQRQEIVQLLRYAAEEIGESPSANEFNSLGLGLSARKVQHVFGSWNDAKREAGLETYEVGEGKSGTSIDVEYFTEIDSEEKSYWLGTLFATSSVRYAEKSSSRMLVLWRVEEKEHFVIGFADAIGSTYSIQRHRNKQTGNKQIGVHISNPEFIDSIICLGYAEPDSEEWRLPNLSSHLRPAFLRGYVESDTRSFTGSPVRIPAKNQLMAETLQSWLGELGIKNHSVTERKGGKIGVNVPNAFNIKALFEGLWPDGVATEPSYTPYPESVLEYLREEYPYPENVPYLSE